MKITIFTHPNEKMDHLKYVVQTIRQNAKVYVDIECDWKKVGDCENVNGIKLYALSDPFETIQKCLEIDADESRKGEKDFRWETINDKVKYNLSEYSELEAACLSYLLWPEICKEYGLDYVFKIEKPSDVFKFLEVKEILNKNIRFKYEIFKGYKPRNLDQYKKISYGTMNLLGRYCAKYGYLNFLKGMK